MSKKTTKFKDSIKSELFSFEKGFYALAEHQQVEVKFKIMELLRIGNEMSWKKYLWGGASLKAKDYEAIARIFFEYGNYEPFGLLNE